MTHRQLAWISDGQGAPYAMYGYGAQMAEVEVDMALGHGQSAPYPRARMMWVGQSIRPLAEGQIEGGIAQGLGLALMEEFIPGTHGKPARLFDPYVRRHVRKSPRT